MICQHCDTELSTGNRSGLCRRHVHTLAHRPEVKARWSASLSTYLRANPEIAMQRAVRASRARLAWCPPEYRDEYRRLTRIKGIRAAAARAIVLDLVNAHSLRHRRTGELQQAI